MSSPRGSVGDDELACLRVAGAFSGQVEAPLDTWTVANLRAHLSARSGFPAESINLICAGKVLKDQAVGTLRQAGVGPNSKILMTRVAAHQQPAFLLAEEERQARLTRIKEAADAIVKRSKRRAFSDDHYDLQLENQSGQRLKFKSKSDQRALMLGLMLHAKARDMLEHNSYNEALEVLKMAEEAFELCDSKILEAVDNVAMLQIDTVWCYFMLKDMGRLADAGRRLSQAREGLHRSHGRNLERLRILQGGFRPELAIYVRLELLEGIIAFHTGMFEAAKKSIVSAQSKYNQLQVSDESLAVLVGMGFSTEESQRALRVSGQDVNSAIEFVMEERSKTLSRREEDRRLNQQRRELKGYGRTPSGKKVDLSKLGQLIAIGYEKPVAAEALRQTENNLDAALDALTDPERNAVLQSTIVSEREKGTKNRVSDESVQELVAMGFNPDQAIVALQKTSSMDEAVLELVQGATKTIKAMESGQGMPSSANVGASEPVSPEESHMKGGTSEDQRDLEMEEDIAAKLTGDPLAEYDIDVQQEGTAILEYLRLLDARTSS